jgi:hypothetical protein
MGGKDVFALAPLDSRLFDPESTPLLNRVRFPNAVWQRVILLMSESSVKGKRKGRVSYRLLSISQLGAVYEALLAYRGFFAAEDLYEVQQEPKKAVRNVPADEEDGEEDGDEEKESFGSSTDMRTTPGSCRPAASARLRPTSCTRSAGVYSPTASCASTPKGASSIGSRAATGRRAPATTRRCSRVGVGARRPKVAANAGRLRVSAPPGGERHGGSLHDRFGQLRICKLRQHFPRW